MHVHFCPLDPTCRDVGAPPRLHVDTKKRHIVIALTKNGRVLCRCGKWRYIDWKKKGTGEV